MPRTTLEPVHDEIAETLNEFRAWLQGRGLAPATIRYYVADVRDCLRWLCEHPQWEMETHDRESANPG